MRAAVLAALAGCGFSPPASSVAASVDAPPMVVGSDGGNVIMPDGPPVMAPCFAPDMSGIKLCLELDDANLVGSGVAHDGSPGRHNATVTDGDVTTRQIPASSPAQLISTTVGAPQVTIQTDDDPDFHLSQLTLMAWVSPSSTPDSTDTYGLVEKHDQWVMDLDDNGDLECVFQDGANTVSPSTISVPVNAWSLVACTYDGNQACAYVATGSAGGGSSQCKSLGIDLEANTEHGVMIGSRWSPTLGVFNHLYGSLDSVRIFDHALSASQLCVGGGRTGC
jgi:hypothetical protein